MSFDGVVVEFDAAVVDEACQAFPARQGVADGISKFALLADQTKLCAEPRLERVDQRAASQLPGCSTLVSVTTANVCLDGIKRGNVFERFAGDREALLPLP